MSIYEVTAAGFDGGTDATDDRVIWVQALDEQTVTSSIVGTGARFCGEVDGADESLDVDFDLLCPEQWKCFRAKLEGFRDNLPEVCDGH